MFLPTFQELPPPPLELFNLDEEFASEKTKLAQLANKCNDSDLEYFVRECGQILGISSKLPAEDRTAKHILAAVLRQLILWKQVNPEAPQL